MASVPTRLSRRFAIAAAILTAVAVLLIALVSFWLIDRQRAHAADLLQRREVAFHAATVGRNLETLGARLAEVAASPILANALVDSAGKETYLGPYLHGLRQMNGIPLQLLFTDFEGVRIADNGSAAFSSADLDWLRARLDQGDERALLRRGPQGEEMIGVALLRYSRTRTPEGALMYKIRLADLRPAPWALFAYPGSPPPAPHEIEAAVPLPPALARLGLRVREDERRVPALQNAPGPQYALILAVAVLLALVVSLLAQRLALGLTRDLRGLERFSRALGDDGISAQRAPLAGSREVVSLARAINRMLDRLYAQHASLEAERRKFHQLANNVPQVVWMADPDGRVTWFNDRWYEFTGAAPGPVLEQDWRDRHDPALLPQVLQRWQAARDKGEIDQMTFPLRGKDGRYRSFFTSVAPLRDGGGAIRQWFGTCTDVTEREQAEHALRLADRRKDEFLAMLAHELRNPLAPIGSAADMLRIAYDGEPRVKQISGIIARQVAHMRHLVDDLLDVSRVTRGLVTVTRSPLDLRRVVAEAVEQSRPLVDARRHALALRIGDDALTVDGDHTRLVQVVANLLTNAAKYTPEGGRIEVDLARAGDEARLVVRDNGNGIAPDLLPAVFDLFTQGSRTLDRAQGGLGLGLALVRKLLELHGGSVDAESGGPGQGSTFTVRLPLLAQALSPD